MNSTENLCPYCGNSLKDNSSNLICMNCGHSLTPNKKFDNVDSKKIGEKDENATNLVVSLGSMWWLLLVLGGIVTSILSMILMFDIL